MKTEIRLYTAENKVFLQGNIRNEDGNGLIGGLGFEVSQNTLDALKRQAAKAGHHPFEVEQMGPRLAGGYYPPLEGAFFPAEFTGIQEYLDARSLHTRLFEAAQQALRFRIGDGEWLTPLS